MFELESHSKHPLILSASCKKLETWQLPVSRADVNIYIMYMRGTSHVSGSPVLLFFCWWYSLLESHWICGSNEFSNYGYVSVDIRKKRKVWFKYRSSRACSFGSQTMREFSEPVSRNRLGQGHR